MQPQVRDPWGLQELEEAGRTPSAASRWSTALGHLGLGLLILVLPEAWEPFVGTAGVLAGAPPGGPGEAATQFL